LFAAEKKGAAQAQANEMQIKITQIIYTLFKPRHRACACDCVRLRCGNEQCVHYTAERLGLEIGHFFASANDLVAFGSIQSVLIVCFWSLIFFVLFLGFLCFLFALINTTTQCFDESVTAHTNVDSAVWRSVQCSVQCAVHILSLSLSLFGRCRSDKLEVLALFVALILNHFVRCVF